MGMAASQGRFLELTARKTNVEFQGQQVNQQRTVLSNQTANYNTQLLGLKVPTPPSSTDFTKTVYTFTDNTSKKQTIDSLTANPDGLTYSIKLTSIETSPGAGYKADKGAVVTKTVVSAPTTTDPKATKNVYTVGNAALFPLDETNDAPALAQLRQGYATAHGVDVKTLSGMAFYGVNLDADSSTYDAYFVKSEVEDAANYSESTINSNQSNKSIEKYLIGSVENTVTNPYTNATITADPTSGRLTTIKYGNNTQAYTLSTTTRTDDAAYKDAMSQYEYEKASYDKAMEDINAKLNIVQQQDKSLELKLKSLDTEQDAISNEMDAVKKVVDKNVEGTFKTFG